MTHPDYHDLRAVYSYYNVATTVSIKDLMHDALILAKQVCFVCFVSVCFVTAAHPPPSLSPKKL